VDRTWRRRRTWRVQQVRRELKISLTSTWPPTSTCSRPHAYHEIGTSDNGQWTPCNESSCSYSHCFDRKQDCWTSLNAWNIKLVSGLTNYPFLPFPINIVTTGQTPGRLSSRRTCWWLKRATDCASTMLLCPIPSQTRSTNSAFMTSYRSTQIQYKKATNLFLWLFAEPII